MPLTQTMSVIRDSSWAKELEAGCFHALERRIFERDIDLRGGTMNNLAMLSPVF